MQMQMLLESEPVSCQNKLTWVENNVPKMIRFIGK